VLFRETNKLPVVSAAYDFKLQKICGGKMPSEVERKIILDM